jgi:cytochrome c-type biogenesis protein CcmH/NrfF
MALLATGAAGALATSPPNFPDVESQYMCVTCNVPLPEAESDQANRERALIRRLIAQGDNEAQIKRVMIAVFTDKVLQLPPRSGFNLVAYIVPVVAVIALVAALLFVLPRWRRRSVEPPDGAAALAEADRVRLDADLARFDT